MNTETLEIIVLGGSKERLCEELERQSAGQAVAVRFDERAERGAGRELQDRLTDLCRTYAASSWLRRTLEKICRCLASRKIRLIYDTSGIRNGSSSSDLEQRFCRFGEPALFRLALVGAYADEDELCSLAKLDGAPLVVCAARSGTDSERLRNLLPGAYVFHAADEWELLLQLDKYSGEDVLYRCAERLLAELTEEIDDEEDWIDPFAGRAALEQLMLWLKKSRKGAANG